MGSSSKVPTSVTGTISTCALIARNNAPGKNGLISPSGVRPPSGKITSGTPLFTPLRAAREPPNCPRRGVRDAADRPRRGLLVHANLSRAFEVPPHDRIRQQFFLERDAELERQIHI